MLWDGSFFVIEPGFRMGIGCYSPGIADRTAAVFAAGLLPLHTILS